MSRSTPLSRSIPLRASAALLSLAIAAFAPSSAARADDTPAAEAASPRLGAIELQIRCLERHLSTLRHARTELAAGRAEPSPADDTAKKVADADRRSLDEVKRYEGARSKVLSALDKAADAKDDAKMADARGDLDRLDTEFIVAIKKIDDSRPPKPAAKGEKKPDAAGKKDMGD